MIKSPVPKTRSFLWKTRPAALLLLDQRRLPQETQWVTCRSWEQVALGIRDMVVRGAPAIGCVAAYGLVLAAQARKFRSLGEQTRYLEKAFNGLLKARPTAVNLKWALERMRNVWSPLTNVLSPKGGEEFLATPLRDNRNFYRIPRPPQGGEDVGEGGQAVLQQTLEREAKRIEEEDRDANRRMGEFGAELIEAGATVLTHCNTGSLATAGLGTAFGVIWTAARAGKIRKVFVTETRPYMQGARLTAWELKNERIPFELITDSMAAHMMKTEKINAILVGADRIAANGDTANKIGTYSLAVLAAHHHVPFYVVAPISTVDLATSSGGDIPIEERSMDEVTSIQGKRMAPKGSKARHPAFDVTPAPLISAIVTERGVAERPFVTSLHRLVNDRSKAQARQTSCEASPAVWRGPRAEHVDLSTADFPALTLGPRP